MTEIIIKLFIIIILVYLSIVDIRKMIVPTVGISAIYAAGVIMMLTCDENVKFYIEGWFFLTISSLAIALFTRGLGGGDVKLLSGLGASLGCHEALKILAFSFILTGIFVIFIHTYPFKSARFKTLKTKKEIPFVPFIALSTFLIFTKKLLYCL